MMTLTRKMTKEELVAFSGEHLYYELNMFFGVSKLLNEGIHDQYIYSALLESFIIHASAILDFFYKPPHKVDDASALHFINDVAKWKKIRPSYDKYFRKFHRRRSREVVHLSYKRLEVRSNEKRWELGKVVPSIQNLVQLFLDVADPELIHPRLEKIKYFLKT
jgi:hypothetical protein